MAERAHNKGSNSLFRCILSVLCLQILNSASSPAANRSAELSQKTEIIGGTVSTAWATLDLVDLVKSSRSNCSIDSRKLVRCAGPLRIEGLTDTSVQGHGVQVQFLNAEAGKGGVELVSATNVNFSDVEIGWLGGGARDPLVPGVERIQSFGSVAACANGETGGVLSLDLPVKGNAALETVSVWDDALGWPWFRTAPEESEVIFPKNNRVAFADGRSNCIDRLAQLIGRRVLARHIVFTNHAFHCVGCRNVTVEKVKVTSAPGMAFVFEGGAYKITLRANVVGPKCAPFCSKPEPSTTADAAHFAGVEGNIVIENNDFGWQGDDGLNITGLLIPALVETQTQESWLRVDDQWKGRLGLLRVGQKILIFDQGLSSKGEAEVLDIARSTGRMKVSRLPSDTGNIIISGVDTIPRNVVIRNNRFHDNRARGILIGASDTLIEKNVIERVTMEAVLVPADTGPWYEGPGSTHVRITHNRISDVNRYPAVKDYPSAISAGVRLSAGYAGDVGTPIRDIVVESNSITNIYSNGAIPVFFGRGVEGGQAKAN